MSKFRLRFAIAYDPDENKNVVSRTDYHSNYRCIWKPLILGFWILVKTEYYTHTIKKESK